MRTIFNFLGPLTNPAGARRQLIGVSDPALPRGDRGRARAARRRARARRLERWTASTSSARPARRAWSRSTAASCAATRSTPEDVGLERAAYEDVAGGPPDGNAQTTRRIFAGEHGPARDLAVLNAGAAIYAGGPRRTAWRRASGPPRPRSTTAPPRRRWTGSSSSRVSWRRLERAGAHRGGDARRGRAPPRDRARCRSWRRALGARPESRPFQEALTRPGHLADRRAQAPLAVGGRDPRGRRASTDVVRAYERGGAAALSILTEPSTSAARSTTCAPRAPRRTCRSCARTSSSTPTSSTSRRPPAPTRSC